MYNRQGKNALAVQSCERGLGAHRRSSSGSSSGSSGAPGGVSIEGGRRDEGSLKAAKELEALAGMIVLIT